MKTDEMKMETGTTDSVGERFERQKETQRKIDEVQRRITVIRRRDNEPKTVEQRRLDRMYLHELRQERERLYKVRDSERGGE